MSTDRRTKAQLIEELDRVKQQVAAVITVDDEARAISACVKALDTLKVRSSSSTYGSSDLKPNRSAIERVLSFLAARYGIRDARADLEAAERRERKAQEQAEELRGQLGYLRQTLREAAGGDV